MLTILLIEDEPAIADNVLYALKTEGFATEWVQLGAEGIEKLRKQAIDLVILDVGLPDGNGFEFCKQIRAFSDLPVIFLTARSDEVDRIVGLEIGADDYVVKPFSPRELTARVKVILRRSKSRESLRAAGHEANVQTRGLGGRHAVRRHGWRISGPWGPEVGATVEMSLQISARSGGLCIFFRRDFQPTGAPCTLSRRIS